MGRCEEEEKLLNVGRREEGGDQWGRIERRCGDGGRKYRWW